MSPTLYLFLANERPLINVDITLLLNMGLWFVLFFFLRATFWKPMLDLIAAREEGTEGARSDAARIDADARKLRASFDEKLQAARQSASRARETVREEGRTAETALMAKVRTEVSGRAEARRAELQTLRTSLRAEVLTAVPALARDIASKVLRREVQP